MRRHAWAVLGLTAAPRVISTANLVDTLVANQCADGLFPASLDTKRCATGDLAATASVMEALTGRPHLVAPPSADKRDVRGTNDEAQRELAARAAPAGVPDGWSAQRAQAFARAGTGLMTATEGDALIRTNSADADGAPVDVVASAASVAGRQAAGLDASATTRALAALVDADGGFATPGTKTDLATTAAAAPGVAGRSWTSAKDAPVAATVLMVPPGELIGDTRATATDQNDAPELSPWLATGFAGLGFVLATALGFGGRYLRNRNSKGAHSA